VINRTKPQDISGIILLNKPTGISSNKALQQVKRHFNAAKAGHVGTLDPLASGLLPICFGEATKFAHILQASTKSYLVTAKLGITTDSGDAEGKILTTKAVPKISEQDLRAVLEKFIGPIQQIPPMFSALKVNGQPLYKLAREGKTIQRAARTIVIDEIKLIERANDHFTIEVTCSKGSYMRTLVEDLGQALGCGAYMSGLIRTKLGSFALTDSISLATLLSANPHESLLQSIDILQPLLFNMVISAKDEQTLRYGQQVLLMKDNLPPQENIGLISESTQQLIGLGKIISGNILITQRLVRQIPFV
jgi:tRNA pseudouridine55 synthase